MDKLLAKSNSKKQKKIFKSKKKEEQPIHEYSNSSPVYNILILGQSESDKSTLIKAIRKYANPSFKNDTEKVKDDSKSRAKGIKTELVCTSLPKYEAIYMKTKQPVDISEYFGDARKFSTGKDPERDFGLMEYLGERIVNFQIFKAPLLGGIHGVDAHQIRRTFSSAMAGREIHLVIIMVDSQMEITVTHIDELRTYKNMFSSMGNITIFLHNNIPNEHQIPQNNSKWQALQRRYESLNDIMEMKLQHFMIDCDLHVTQPVHNCFMYNRILSILQKATSNKPVQVDSIPIHKTEKMLQVDKHVAQYYLDLYKKEDRTYKHLAIAFRLNSKKNDVQKKIEEMKLFLKGHDTDDPVLIYQNRFDKNWRRFSRRKPVLFEFPPHPYPISRREVVTQFAVKILEESGGEGCDTWRVKFKRNAFESGIYHVRLFTEKRNKFRREISLCKTQQVLLEDELQGLEEQLKMSLEQLRENNSKLGTILDPISVATTDITAIIYQRSEYAKILSWAEEKTITWGMCKALDEAKAYEGDNLAESMSATILVDEAELIECETLKERGIMDQKIFAKLIVIGPKGDGKATVANMLVQGKLLLKNRFTEKPYNKESEVELASLKVLDGRGWVVCVVDGVQDLENGTSEHAISIRQKLKYVMREGEEDDPWGFHMFCIVLRYDHVFNSDVEHYAASFRTMFPDAVNQFVLIITDCNEQWIGEHQDMLGARFCDFKIIPVHFPFDENLPYMFQSHCDIALKTFEETLSTLRKGVIAPELFMQRTTAKRTNTRKTIVQAPVYEYVENAPTFNILILGQSQSGKSTLIEAIRKYANPLCDLNVSRIGNGVKSHTKNVVTQHVYTDLPEYTVVNVKTNETIKTLEYFENPNQFVGTNPKSDFGLHTYDKPDASIVHFQIFDTPGLDDTNGTDVHHIRRTLSTIMDARQIHLVIVMVNTQVHVTEGLRDALKTYRNVFSPMGEIMIFLHTKVPNEDQFPEKIGTWKTMRERMDYLDQIMNQKLPHYMINCDLQENRPIHNCFMYNKILSILQLATFNRPVQVDSMPLHKTEKMLSVDNIVSQHYLALFKSEDRTCKELDIAYQLKAKIEDTQRSIEAVKSFIRTHDTDRLVIIYQNYYDDNWKLTTRREPVVFEFPARGYPIDRRDVLQFQVKILEESEEGCDTWRTKFKRNAFEFGAFHVKLYTKQCNKYRREISLHKTQLTILENELQSLEEQQTIRLEQLQEVHNRSGSGGGIEGGRYAILKHLSESTIAEMMTRRSRYARILGQITKETLTWGMYKALDEAKVYEGDKANCSKKVQEFYATYQPLFETQFALTYDDIKVPLEDEKK
ncbi:hypothetical protein BGX27_006971 [Mortierella sp. AM989]|nr:hypothetical protein BGX27_006971 [Mortierella sp. AM989]